MTDDEPTLPTDAAGNSERVVDPTMPVQNGQIQRSILIITENEEGKTRSRASS